MTIRRTYPTVGPIVDGRQAAVHPAPWHRDALARIAEILNSFARHHVLGQLGGGPDRLRLIDPMAGGGGIFALTDHAMLHDPRWEIAAGEIENDFAKADRRVDRTDAVTALSFETRHGPPAAIVLSPPFGNRMADTYLPPESDDSIRLTYAVALGHAPDPGSAAGLRFGPAYRGLMAQIYAAVVHAAGPDTIVIVEIADHVRDGRRVAVADWTRWTIQMLGLRWDRTETWRWRRVRFDTSGIEVRDDLLVFRGGRRHNVSGDYIY